MKKYGILYGAEDFCEDFIPTDEQMEKALEKEQEDESSYFYMDQLLEKRSNEA